MIECSTVGELNGAITLRAVDYDQDRSEMLEFVPASARRVLDVGCATGRFGNALRASRPDVEVLWGIDPTPHSDIPQSYDTRIVGSFPDDLPLGQEFDCVVFNDVLEHMVDPWDTLRKTREVLAIGARVIVSVPNVRHISVVRPLLLHGRWDYRDEGILDRTHLRFFTRTTAIELLASTGYTVETVARMQWPGTHTTGFVAGANRMLRGRLDDFFAHQYAIVAHADDARR